MINVPQTQYAVLGLPRHATAADVKRAYRLLARKYHPDVSKDLKLERYSRASVRHMNWVCGKTSSNMVALVMVAMWVGSNLARFAPLPQGALLTLLYRSIKLQVDLN